jgi:formyl-CoA transferase
MSGHGITFGVISRPQDVPGDEQAAACGAVVDTAIPEMPRTLANPIRLGFAEQQIAKPAPALGQHSEQILAEAGLSRDEIASLRASGAIR